MPPPTAAAVWVWEGGPEAASEKGTRRESVLRTLFLPSSLHSSPAAALPIISPSPLEMGTTEVAAPLGALALAAASTRPPTHSAPTYPPQPTRTKRRLRKPVLSMASSPPPPLRSLAEQELEGGHHEENDFGVGGLTIALALGILCRVYFTHMFKVPYTVLVLIFGLIFGVLIHEVDLGTATDSLDKV
jgi:hypothetical protein